MNRFIRISGYVILLLFFSITIMQSTVAAAGKAIIFAVPPDGNPEQLKKQWKPLIDHIARESRLLLKFATAKNMKEFNSQLKKGAYDIVYVNAYWYTRFHEDAGFTAFAKLKDTKDKGVIVVRKDSDIKSLDDLKSRKLALSNPDSFESTMLSKLELQKKGIQVKPTYLESTDSVYKAVVRGRIPAGSGDVNSLNTINPNSYAKLRVIWSSNQFSSHAFAAHSRVNPEVLARLTSSLVELDNSLEGKRLLNDAKLKPITPAEDAEWNDVRALNLTKLKKIP